jgi:hypothetical protein
MVVPKVECWVVRKAFHWVVVLVEMWVEWLAV